MKPYVVYILFYLSFAIAILEFIFFLLFIISYGHQNNLQKSVPFATYSTEWSNNIKGIIALEFFMFFFGVGQFVFYILAFKCNKHFTFFTLSIFSLLCFICCWFTTIILFCKSKEFEFIKTMNSDNSITNKMIYSLETFNQQMNKWSEQQPLLFMRAIGSSNDKICSGYINITSIQNKEHFFDKKSINFKEISGDSIAIINILINIEWENENKIEVLKNEIQKCTKSKSIQANVSKIDGLRKIPSTVLITKNGKIPKKLTKSSSLSRAIFGLGLDVITDLSSIPVYERTMNIIDSFNYSFECNKFIYQCFDLPNRNENNELFDNNEIETKKQFFTRIKSFFASKTPKSISREILSRSFYLSKSAYNQNFDYFYNDLTNKYTKFKSGKLINIIKQNNESSFFKPAWFEGTHGKELYIAIRGTNSLKDWVADLSAADINYSPGESYHAGFYLAALNVWKEISGDIFKYNKDGYKIIFTGHSYGASVAQILHFFSYKNNVTNIYSYVFGAATPMSKSLGEKIKSNSYLFVYRHDIVPRLMKFVTDHKFFKKTLSDIVIFILSLFNFDIINKSNLWSHTGKEYIIDPVGTVYHLPCKENDIFSKWGSISKTIIKKFDTFYDYNLISASCAIIDHDLMMYFSNMMYDDGLIMPKDF